MTGNELSACIKRREAVIYARGSEVLSRGKDFEADRIFAGEGFDADRGTVEFDADRIFAGTGFRCG